LVSACKAAGDYAVRPAHALQLTHHDPLREEAQREVLRLHFLLGQHKSRALQHYQRYRTLVQAELKQEPMRKPRRLREILHWRDAAAPAQQTAALPLKRLTSAPRRPRAGTC